MDGGRLADDIPDREYRSYRSRIGRKAPSLLVRCTAATTAAPQMIIIMLLLMPSGVVVVKTTMTTMMTMMMPTTTTTTIATPFPTDTEIATEERAR